VWYVRNMPPSMYRGVAVLWGGDMDTAIISVFSCSSPGQLADSSCSIFPPHGNAHPHMSIAPPPFARGGLPEAIHPIPNRLRNSAALPILFLFRWEQAEVVLAHKQAHLPT
jgi:hypothetical protein